MRLIAALLSAVSCLGCKPGEAAPKTAGVSKPLDYPVLLIGQSSLDVRDSEGSLISIPGASGLNLNERVILDSQGRLFKVTSARPIAGQRSSLWDMGASARRFFVEVAEQRRPSWEHIEKLVLEQVCSPASVWAGDERAVKRVRALRDAGALIEASRESWNWAR